MKVYIGPYDNWIGPYQIAEKLMFWANKYENKNVHKFGEFLAHGFAKEKVRPDGKRYMNDARPYTMLYRLCQWYHDRKPKRKIEVHIDGYDIWSADHTMSMIILPMLVKLRDAKCGSPFTDDGDVPEELRSYNAPPKKNEWDTDENHSIRWEWVLNEMIWAHQQVVNDDEPEFWKVQPEGMYSIKSEDNPNMSELHWDKSGEFDYDAAKAYRDRMDNGFRLFGKYYRALWT